MSIASGESIVLDTSTLIAYLNASEAASPAARMIVDDLIATERNPAILSSITVAEMLVQPLRELGRVPNDIKGFLLGFPGLSVRSADFLLASEAALIRARTGASMPDALVAATATVTSSQWLITNDQVLANRLKGFSGQWAVLLLSDLRVPAA